MKFYVVACTFPHEASPSGTGHGLWPLSSHDDAALETELAEMRSLWSSKQGWRFGPFTEIEVPLAED